MFSPTIRWIAIALGVGVAVLGGLAGHAGGVLYGLLLALLLTYGHVRYASVWLAGRRIRAGDLDGGRKLLSATPIAGRWLARRHRAYFHLLRAGCRLESNDLDGVETDAAEALRLHTDPGHRASVLALLIVASNRRGDLDAARRHTEALRATGYAEAFLGSQDAAAT